jgi:Tol biopolymer transport system component
MIVTGGEGKDGEGSFWIIPLSGDDPFLLELDVSVAGKPRPLCLSPDCKKLVFMVERSDEEGDLYVVSVSLRDGRTIGSAVMIFSGLSKKHGGLSWSPDGMKIAVGHKGDIWIASVEGGEPVQVTKNPDYENKPDWSPDGKMLCYEVRYSERERILRVLPASGSEDTIVLDIPLVGRGNTYEWSADSKDLIVLQSGGVLSAISIADGKSRQKLDLKGLTIDTFCWSPDMQELAFTTWRESERKHQIFVISADGGKPTELAADNSGEIYCLYWSPDGKWMSYNSDGNIKTRPGGEIWEADVSELLSNQEME